MFDQARIYRDRFAWIAGSEFDENSPLKLVPWQIVTAWYMGIVGDGAKARCLAYETALNAQVVADVLKPPTYADGAYGSWARKPI